MQRPFDKPEYLISFNRCHIFFQMAVKLTQDFGELIETYEDELNEEMILKGPLRRGLAMQLHSKVGRTEYLRLLPQ